MGRKPTYKELEQTVKELEDAAPNYTVNNIDELSRLLLRLT